MLLHNFAAGGQWLYSFDKSLRERGVQRSSVKKFCAENDIYTVYDEHGNRDVSAEMKRDCITKTEMARRMATLDRLLDLV